MSMIFEIAEAELRIKYTFRNKSLLRQAFTHSSYANENNVQCNERLEFLGDSVLNFVIAEHLYKKFPHYAEGELTRHRATVVSAQPLASAAERLRLADMMMLGEGERRSEHKSINVYSDLFESVVAAIYLDGGLKCAKNFIMYALKQHIAEGSNETDFKSQLSQFGQKTLKKRVSYVTLSQSGPSHSPVFNVQVKIGNKIISEAQSDSKKAAQQLAAKKALEMLRRGSRVEL